MRERFIFKISILLVSIIYLNKDGEPLVDSENEEEEEENDTMDNKLSSEKESESPLNSEEESIQPDLIIRTRHKNYFGSLKQSRLHKSSPAFEINCFQPITTTTTNDLIETTNKQEKLVGKATVIRRSTTRPSIAHLKAMFENMNMPNPDGFTQPYNRNKKTSLLKRSMSTREKVGSFNTWSTNNLNLYGQHGSFENLNYFNSKNEWNNKNYSKDSDDSNESEESKHDESPFYNHNQFNEPIYGFKKESVDEIDKDFIIENTILSDLDLPPPPAKPPRTYVHDQQNTNNNSNELIINEQQQNEFKRNSDAIINNNVSLNNNQFNQLIDYMPNYLNSMNKAISSSKNYYNTIGPIKTS